MYQDRSIRWDAIFCPVVNRWVELGRCVRGLKYPRVDEKFKMGFCLGLMRVCVIFESSSAMMMPSKVIIMAVVFVVSGMVMGGVFVGRV